MLDPITTGCVVAIVAAIAAVVFYLMHDNDESDFEKAFGANSARRLLKNDKDKARIKAKAAKKKEKKDAARSDDAVVETVVAPTIVAEEPPTSPPVTEEPAVVSEVKPKEQMKPSTPQKSKSEKKNEKGAKKIVEEVCVPAEAEVEPNTSETTNLNDLDWKNVFDRFASIQDVEPEYINFLADFFEHSNQQMGDLKQTVEQMQKEMAEWKQKAELNSQNFVNVEKEAASLKRRNADLEKQLNVAKETVDASGQAAEKLDALVLENETLRAALTKSAASMTDSNKLRRELETVNNDRTQITSRVAQLETDLVAQMKANSELQKQSVETLAHLQEDFHNLEMSARQVKAQLEERTRQLEDLRQVGQIAETARDELSRQFAIAAKEWQEKETRLLSEYHSLKALVDELNKEVANFEEFKHEQHELLVAREAELTEKSRQLAEIEGQQQKLQLEQENEALNSLKTELETNELQSEMTAIASTSASVVEVTAISMTTDVDETPQLRAEIERLQKKNDELRQRNFKILDDMKALEKTAHSTVVPEQSCERGDVDEIKCPAVDGVSSMSNEELHLKAQVNTYRNALETLSNELSRIEAMSRDEKSKYETEIGALKQKAEKAQIKSLKQELGVEASASGDLPVSEEKTSTVRRKVLSERQNESTNENQGPSQLIYY